MSEEKRNQVVAQCNAVCHLAKCLIEVHSDCARMFATGSVDNLIDQVGNRTAHFMEALGDMLNGMDAVTEEDAWLDPIYKEAHRLWPQPPDNPRGGDEVARKKPKKAKKSKKKQANR